MFAWNKSRFNHITGTDTTISGRPCTKRAFTFGGWALADGVAHCISVVVVLSARGSTGRKEGSGATCGKGEQVASFVTAWPRRAMPCDRVSVTSPDELVRPRTRCHSYLGLAGSTPGRSGGQGGLSRVWGPWAAAIPLLRPCRLTKPWPAPSPDTRPAASGATR